MRQDTLRIKLIMLVGLLFLGGIRSADAANDEIVWRHNYSQALQEAQDEGRPLLVKVSATWCSHCVKMQSETLANTSVVDEVSNNFVALELDADRDRELISRFNVGTYPTTIIVAPDRKILDRLVGFRNSREYSASLRSALNRFR